MALIPTVTMHTENSIQSVCYILVFESPVVLLGQVFNLSCEGRQHCRDYDAGADVFLPPNLQ